MREFVPADPALLEQRWRLLKIKTSLVIDAPPEKVWRVISDHETWTEWHADHDEHQPITDETEGLGATFHTKDWILRSESAITRWEAGHTLGLTILRATAWRWLLRSYYTELRVEPTDDGTDRSLVHYRVAFTGTIIFWLLSAYSVGYSLGSIWWNARSSLKGLERVAMAADQGEGS